MQGIRDVMSLEKAQEDQLPKTAEGEVEKKILVRRTQSMDSYLNRQGDNIPYCLECKDHEALKIQNSRAGNRTQLLEEALTAVGVEIPVVPIEEALSTKQSTSSAIQILDDGKKLLEDLGERHRRQLQSAEQKHNKELRRVYDRYEANRKEEVANLDQRLEAALNRNKYLEDQRTIHKKNIQALIVEKARLESVLHWGTRFAPHLQQHRNVPPPGLEPQGPPAMPGVPCGHTLSGPWQQPMVPYIQDPMAAPHPLPGTEVGQMQLVYPPLLANTNQTRNSGYYVPPNNMPHDRPMTPPNATQTTLSHHYTEEQARYEAEKLRRERGNFQGEISRLAQLLGEEKAKYLRLQGHLERVERDLDLEKAKSSTEKEVQSTIIRDFQQENQNLQLEGNALRLKIAALETEIRNFKQKSEELMPADKALEKNLGIMSNESQNLKLKQDLAALGEEANMRVGPYYEIVGFATGG